MSQAKAFIYPGRFDPITLGHEHIARRAAALCERLLIAVATLPGNRPFSHTLDERCTFCAEALKDLPNAEIVPLEGLLADCARSHGAQAIIKGVRNAEDYARELSMAEANRRLGEGLETIILPSWPEFAHISSTLAREIASYPDADCQHLLSRAVIEKLGIKG